MGVTIDKALATGSNGIYVFRAQGTIYHLIGSIFPNVNSRPRYLQMWIVDIDHEIDNRLLKNQELRRDLLVKIQSILDRYNPFVQVFRQIGQRQDIPSCKLIIKKQNSHQRQYCLPTASKVAAFIADNEGLENLNGRDIVVQGVNGHLTNIQDISGYYDPLQYPFLLPYGTYGWDINSRNVDRTRLTCLDYNAFILQFYKGLQDFLDAGENNTGNIGRRIVLPSSFTSSPRDMYQRYQDVMTLVQTYGKPDLMLTMTCNPHFNEIKDQLLPGQQPQDRPDLITWVFRAKFEEFKKDIVEKGVLGKVISYSYAIEFQKRGLPHVHMLVIFENIDKLRTPDDFDSVVRAEIPSRTEEPNLFEAVTNHMIHGSCGLFNPNSPCMSDEYVAKFTSLLKFAPHIAASDEAQADQFINGLNPEVFTLVNAGRPNNFADALNHAKGAEAGILRQRGVQFVSKPVKQPQVQPQIPPPPRFDAGGSGSGRKISLNKKGNSLNDQVLALLVRVEPDSLELDRDLMFTVPSVGVVTRVSNVEECLEAVIFAIRQVILHEFAHSVVLEVHRFDDHEIEMDCVVLGLSDFDCITGIDTLTKRNWENFLYRSILAHPRKNGKIVIAVATSGIAATLLPGGRTAHSRLKIPLRPTAKALCTIEKQKDTADLIRRLSAIVKDWASLAQSLFSWPSPP
ncbi:uncharacterized protein [Henckelia pumila]|uniref:uncharacterized protein n=1 Tax=Henckelia pumila TaxID=405737 RepID=UPI003C6E9DD6